MNCGICSEMLGDDNYDDNMCAFCEAPICCDCYDSNNGCFFPGEAWCKTCKSNILSCKECKDHIRTLMKGERAPPCRKHPKYEFL